MALNDISADVLSHLPAAEPGSFESSGATYPSLVAFMLADERRAGSRERDVGLQWHDASTDRTFRAAWVEDTGELYVVQAGAPEQGGGHVEVLAVIPDPAELERGLSGWRERCGTAGSYEWLRQTARQAFRRPSARPALA